MQKKSVSQVGRLACSLTLVISPFASRSRQELERRKGGVPPAEGGARQSFGSQRLLGHRPGQTLPCVFLPQVKRHLRENQKHGGVVFHPHPHHPVYEEEWTVSSKRHPGDLNILKTSCNHTQTTVYCVCGTGRGERERRGTKSH